MVNWPERSERSLELNRITKIRIENDNDVYCECTVMDDDSCAYSHLGDKYKDILRKIIKDRDYNNHCKEFVKFKKYYSRKLDKLVFENIELKKKLRGEG